MTALAFDPAFVARVSTARPAEMTALLLEEAIRELDVTIAAIGEKAIEKRYMASARALKIVDFLHETLDYEAGGDIAVNLDKVYRLAMARICRINPFNDVDSAKIAQRILEPQAAAWRAIDAQEQADDDMPEIKALPGLMARQARPAGQPVYAR